MSKKSLTTLYAAIIFSLTSIILLYPADCLSFALNGLNLWFQKMIPALFPFMVLSGIMVRMDLKDHFIRILSPILRPVFRLSNPCLYVIFAGFLCGFPMGAHVTAQLYTRKQITKNEAQLLLSFCNNIGPVYFISFALPSIGITNKSVPLLAMYGLPMLYGLVLRHSFYAKSITSTEIVTKANRKSFAKQLYSCEEFDYRQNNQLSFLAALDESVTSSLTSITRLGGYMIFFNLLYIIPELLFPKHIAVYFNCLLEITGGIIALQNRAPFFALVMLSFGGFSCLAQTYSIIKACNLSIKSYFFHKTLLTAFSVFFYVVLAITTS